jgi:hypothetical protein
MKIEGTLKHILEMKSGVSQQGREWKSLDVVVEIPGRYPEFAVIGFFGDPVDTIVRDFKEGMEVAVEFDLKAQQYEGRWYNRLSGWKCEALRQATSNQTSPPWEAPVSPPSALKIPAEAIPGHEYNPPF